MRGGVRIAERNKYDYDNHVSFCEAVESVREAPGVDDACLPRVQIIRTSGRISCVLTRSIQSFPEDNGSHVCPLQLSVCERLIERYSNRAI